MEFDGLVIEAELPASGASRLFLASRRGPLGFQRRVVLKTARDERAGDPRVEAHLLAEAAHAAAVAHPNVRGVERVSAHEGRTVVVLEHVDGCSLAELLDFLRSRRRRLRPELAVHLALQAASALHATHASGARRDGAPCLLHRDVSPPNVLLARSGHVKLIDLGASRDEGCGEAHAPTRRPSARARYAAPEESRGEEVDRTADVYSLAACLWELLTLCPAEEVGRRGGDGRGRPGGGAALPVAPGRLAPAIPSALDRVVLRALATCPEDRYPTARAFRHALAGAAPGALLIEEGEVASLVAEVLAHALPPAPRDDGATPSHATAVLAPERLEALRRRARGEGDARGREPGPPTARRRLALAVLSLALSMGAGLAAREGARARAVPGEPAALAKVEPPTEAPPAHAPPEPSSDVRTGPSVASPAGAATLPLALPPARPRASRPRRSRPVATPASEPTLAEDWPVAVLDELGPWDAVSREP